MKKSSFIVKECMGTLITKIACFCLAVVGYLGLICDAII